jgi:type I restriction enzyme S subunit
MNDAVTSIAEEIGSRWKPYPVYKDSGSEFLGEIPEHWEVKRGRFLFCEIDSRSENGTELLLSLTKERGLISREELTERVARADTLVGYKKCYIGDIVMNKMQAWNGMFGYVWQPGIVSPDYTVFRPLHDYNGRYYTRLFTTQLYVEEFRWRSRGMGTAFLRLNTSDFNDVEILLPPITEQYVIASFLDRETTHINTLIAKKERLIELLTEKRSALISHAVTKGLDPTVPMKDSGVEWLGEILVHWEVKRLKFLTSFVTSGSRGWAQYYSDYGAIFLRIGNLSRTSIDPDLSDIQYVCPPQDAEGERTRVNQHDVLISITASIGSIAVMRENIGEAYVNQHIALTRPRQDTIVPRWLGYCLMSQVGKEQFALLLYGGTKDGLGLDDVNNLVVLLPPISEQRAVVSFIDCETSKIDALITKVRAHIEKLKEYRTALISAAVTGKIDVREEIG